MATDFFYLSTGELVRLLCVISMLFGAFHALFLVRTCQDIPSTVYWYILRDLKWGIAYYCYYSHRLGWSGWLTVFAEINAHPQITALKTVIFQRGEYTKPMAFDGDFSKGGVHKTDGFWWVSFQRGEYTKPMGFGMGLECFFIAAKN